MHTDRSVSPHLRRALCAAMMIASGCSNGEAPPFEPTPDAAPSQTDAANATESATRDDATTETDLPPCGGHMCPYNPGDLSVACLNNVCVATACTTGWVLCNGRCRPVAPEVGCGASTSCEPCAPPANANARCEMNRCAFTCREGFAAIGDRCVALPTPRPVSPPNRSYVFSRMPAVCVTAWLVAPTTGLDVEFLNARGERLRNTTATTPCVNVPPEVLVDGTPVYWRARATAASSSGPWSTVWTFTPAFRNNAVGTWQRGAVDVEGDGPGDLLLAMNSGATSILPGAGDLRARRMAVVLPPAEAMDPSRTLTFLDLNGDHHAEVLGGFPRAERLRLWRSPATTSTPDITLPAPAGISRGDGFGALPTPGAFSNSVGDDLAVASTAGTRVAVFANLATAPRVTVLDVGGVPRAMAAGSITGSRFDDLAVATMERIAVFRGAEEAIRTSSLPAVALDAPPVALAVADVLFDGYADAVLRSAGALKVYRASPTGLSDVPVQTLPVAAGSALVCADLLGDAAPDCAVEIAATQEIAVYRGGAAGLSLSPALTRSAVGVERGAIRDLVLRDLDGDGRIDLAALAIDRDTTSGVVLVYRGQDGGLATEPVVIQADTADDSYNAPMR